MWNMSTMFSWSTQSLKWGDLNVHNCIFMLLLVIAQILCCSISGTISSYEIMQSVNPFDFRLAAIVNFVVLFIIHSVTHSLLAWPLLHTKKHGSPYGWTHWIIHAFSSAMLLKWVELYVLVFLWCAQSQRQPCLFELGWNFWETLSWVITLTNYLDNFVYSRDMTSYICITNCNGMERPDFDKCRKKTLSSQKVSLEAHHAISEAEREYH